MEVGGARAWTHIPAAPIWVFPLFFPQKDLLLSEIPSGSTSLRSRKTGVEKAMAKEICLKYLEKRAGQLPDDCAEALAAAACLCLRRRNASLAEVSLFRRLPAAMSLPWGRVGLLCQSELTSGKQKFMDKGVPGA